MAEYIERDEAVRKAITACIKIVGHGITQFDAVDIADEIDSIPTADVAEVRHGEWVKLPFGMRICSECRYLQGKKKRFEKRNYCPNCGAKMGAKMDGKGEGE